MKITFLGGAREVGRSAILVNDRLLLDYGIKNDTPLSYPVDQVSPDAVVVSHGHLDHAGAVPALCSGDNRPSIHLTPPTGRLTTELAQDTLKLHGGTYNCPFTEVDVKRVTQLLTRHSYGETFTAADHQITFYDAGHIPGSAHILVDDGDTRLFYTGDFAVESQCLVDGSTARPDADVVISESTYADTTRKSRTTIESEFIEFVQQRLWAGGTVVVPAFAIGRTQEVISLLADANIGCYLDGMGQRISRLFCDYPDFLDTSSLRAATRHARFVNGQDGQRARIANQNTVIVTTAGMLQGGPAMTYIPEIASNPANAIALTGYQVEGSPGRELLESGRLPMERQTIPVSARVRQFDLSAHADRNDLLSFLQPYSEKKILLNHGDRATDFASGLQSDGFDAVAPETGETVFIEP